MRRSSGAWCARPSSWPASHSTPPSPRGRRTIMRDQPQDRQWFTTGIFALAVVLVSTSATAQTDPGPRGGAAGAGTRVTGLTLKEGKFFDLGLDAFTEVASVIGSVA